MIAVLLLFALIIALIVGLWGLGTTVSGLVRRRPRRSLRGLAMVTGSIAVVVYASATAFVAMELGDGGTDSSPPHACQTALPDRDATITGYDAGYFPPHFNCHLNNGTQYSGHVVPRFVLPITLVATTATVLLALAARRPVPARSVS
ncbi:hypothetical protein AB0E69_38950 [Kribbella sp. NPDC026611]|uniref:hypothetical protein n=1 Tax=Kribbella sp. NPDC026611 TaxID=3154911 RepID=UPI0033CAFCD7